MDQQTCNNINIGSIDSFLVTMNGIYPNLQPHPSHSTNTSKIVVPSYILGRYRERISAYCVCPDSEDSKILKPITMIIYLN